VEPTGARLAVARSLAQSSRDRVRLDAMDEADFYTGLVARLYSPLRSVDPDPDPYARFIAVSGEPALELGCGDGDPMLELRRRGIQVTGVDSSADMLDRLRTRAGEMDLEVVVHHQRMQDLALGTTFRSVYLAGPTFNLLPDEEVAAQALVGIRTHLAPGGSALIPLFIPDALPAGAIGHPSEHVDEDGTVLRFLVLAESIDESAQRLVRATRYEAIGPDGTTESAERDWVLHWYTQDGFRSLAEAAGLDVRAVIRPDATPAQPDDDVFVFILTCAQQRDRRPVAVPGS
jgi:SAM-dependent methyltransferase